MIDAGKLRDRLREIVSPNRGAQPRAAASVEAAPPSSLEAALGGAWRGSTFIIERESSADVRYGEQTVGDIAEGLRCAVQEAVLLTGRADAAPQFLFFDLETTGLNGGAGTYAFLVGSAWFDNQGAFRTRQYLLCRGGDEVALLAAVESGLAESGTLVTFNGKSFDAPLLETRCLFHRRDWFGSRLPHLDVLHPARQLWGDPSTGCSLTQLERQLLGVRRAGDLPGFEAPARYFQFIRSGDASLLAAVVEHNRADMLALAAVTARLFALVRRGPCAALTPREALGLGRLYARTGRHDEALAAFERAVALMDGGAPAFLAAEALRALALAYRRLRRYDAAAACWQRLLNRGCDGAARREACEALAIHHEHRVRDLAAARTFALRSLESAPRERWEDAVRHRLARIERKQGAVSAPPLFPSSPSWPSPPSSGLQRSGRRISS